MSHPVEVRTVENRADFSAFFEFPWTLYKDDPNWVPPLLSIRRDLLDQNKHPSWEYMEGTYFAAWRGGQIVGTIVALINHRHNEFHGEHIGWFGMFEVLDDGEAAIALLNTAAEWVKERGYDTIRGPQSFTTHEECGLLVDNFTRPVLLMPYNPPYYQGLVEDAGYQKVMDVYSFYYDRKLAAESKTAERMARLVERAKKRSNISVRPVNRKHLKAEFELFKELYNGAWDKNWGFTPMTEKELDAMVESLGQFFEPSMAAFAEVEGTPAGFILGVPDFNEVLQRAYPRPGVPELVSLAKAGWYWKVRPVIETARIPLMGVLAAYRGKGVDIALYDYIIKALLPSRYNFLDSGWILETNPLVKMAEGFGMPIYKTHRFYEKRFNSRSDGMR